MKHTNEPAELTEDQISVIIKGREKGLSIKAIARSLHISDKRVAAFVRLLNEEKKRDMSFHNFVREACNDADKACRHFMATLFSHVYDEMEEVADGKKHTQKEIKKHVKKALNESLDAYMDSALLMAIVAMWTMPAKFKALWLDNCNVDPKGPKKNK